MRVQETRYTLEGKSARPQLTRICTKNVPKKLKKERSSDKTHALTGLRVVLLLSALPFLSFLLRFFFSRLTDATAWPSDGNEGGRASELDDELTCQVSLWDVTWSEEEAVDMVFIESIKGRADIGADPAPVDEYEDDDKDEDAVAVAVAVVVVVDVAAYLLAFEGEASPLKRDSPALSVTLAEERVQLTRPSSATMGGEGGENRVIASSGIGLCRR